MINEAIREKDFSRSSVLVEPVDQRIVSISNFAPASVMDREEIDDTTRNNGQRDKNCGEFTWQRRATQRKMPQSPNRKSNEKVSDNDPDVNEFLVSKDLDCELERKGNCKKA